MSTFPSSLDDIPEYDGDDSQLGTHAELHNLQTDAILAIESYLLDEGSQADAITALTARIALVEDGQYYHLNLLDTATNGHPDFTITVTPAGFVNLAPTDINVHLALVALDAAIQPVPVHNALAGRSSTGAHPASAISVAAGSILTGTDAAAQLAQADVALAGASPSLVAYAATDQAVTASTAFVNDAALTIALAANSRYEFTGLIWFDAATADDFKYQYTLPAGASMTILDYGQGTGATAAIASVDQAQHDGVSSTARGSIGAASIIGMRHTGIINTVGTAGSVTFRFAQNASGGTTTRRATSYLKATRIGTNP